MESPFLKNNNNKQQQQTTSKSRDKPSSKQAA